MSEKVKGHVQFFIDFTFDGEKNADGTFVNQPVVGAHMCASDEAIRAILADSFPTIEEISPHINVDAIKVLLEKMCKLSSIDKLVVDSSVPPVKVLH